MRIIFIAVLWLAPSIALAALILASRLVVSRVWPSEAYVGAAAGATAIGLGCTPYSEWLKTMLHQNWAYRSAMPTLLLNTGRAASANMKELRTVVACA